MRLEILQKGIRFNDAAGMRRPFRHDTDPVLEPTYHPTADVTVDYQISIVDLPERRCQVFLTLHEPVVQARVRCAPFALTKQKDLIEVGLTLRGGSPTSVSRVSS